MVAREAHNLKVGGSSPPPTMPYGVTDLTFNNSEMGKTKDITINNDGTCTFTFKDDVCSKDGVIDPGANQIEGLKIDGKGRASLLLSQHFFPRLRGVPTHFRSANVEEGTMECTHLNMLPIEFIWRSRAWGSFCKAYGVEQGLSLMCEAVGFVEATLKDDALGDPRISRPALNALGKLTLAQYDECALLTRITGIILQSKLEEYGLELIDFKVEFGLDRDGQIVLADEISGDIWRVLDKDGQPMSPVECAKRICPECYSISC